MLMQKIRDWVTGWVAIVIMGLLIITFAVWGINFGGQNPELIAASVNGEEIKLKKFQRFYSNSVEQMRQRMNRVLTNEEQAILKEQSLDYLIRDTIIAQTAIDSRIEVSNAAVKDAVKGIEVFSDEIGFNREIYEGIVTRSDMTPAIFEQQLRADLMSKQLQNTIISSAFVIANEASRLTKINEQLRDIAYIILLAEDLKEDIVINDDAIQQFYDNNSDGLISLEQIKIAYLEFSVDRLIETITSTEGDLRNYYQDNKDQYDEQEQRKVSAVNIEISDEATDEDIAVAMKKVEQIRKLIGSDVSFAEIVDDHSLDTEVQVIEYGYTARGVFPADIEEIVFSMEENQLSEVERTETGIHIFKVFDSKGGDKNTFEYVREKVEADYKITRAELKYFELADQLVTLTYEHIDTLEVAAEVVGIDIQESDFFSRATATGILADTKILDAAFTRETIDSGENSDAIELSDNHVVVFQVLEHLPAEKKPLEEVKEQIIQTLISEQATSEQHDKGQEIIRQLEQISTFEEVAEQMEFEWQQLTNIARDDVSVNRTVLRKAFQLAHPVDGIKFTGIKVGIEDYAVVVVSKVTYPDTITDEDLEQSEAQLRQSISSNEWSMLVKELHDRSKITINSTVLN